MKSKIFPLLCFLVAVPSLIAMAKNHLSEVKSCINQTRSMGELMEAAEKGLTDEFEQLCQNPAIDINAQNQDGRTPFSCSS